MKESDRPVLHFPLAAFLVFYATTFLIGAVFLLTGPNFFVTLFVRTVGIKPFWLEAPAVFSNWLLVLGAPVLFAAGWVGVSRRGRRAEGSPSASLPMPYVVGVYGVSVAFAGFSLARSSAFLHAGSWFNSDALIHARFVLFDRLSFVEWTNIYMLLPTLSGLLAVRVWKEPWSATRRQIACLAILLLLIAVEILGFQKRYVVLSLIFATACAVVNAPSSLARSKKGLGRIAVVGGLAYVAYSALLVAPQLQIKTDRGARAPIVQGETTGLLQSTGAPRTAVAPEPVTAAGQTGLAPVLQGRPRDHYTEIRYSWLRAVVERAFPGRWIGAPAVDAPSHDSFSRRLVFALLAPITRTPPPALAYPGLFPRVLPFFGLDVGSDVVGLGRMPDDNLLVYGAMYGQLDKGASSVPFQYSWFSQVGLFGALLLCAPLGAACALAWLAVLEGTWPPEVRAVLGALVILFCVEVSQDSVRGSLLNSYGIGWGAVLVLAMARVFRSRTLPTRSGRS